MTLKHEPVILRFIKIGHQTLRIFIMKAASFAADTDHISQLGVMGLALDNDKRFNGLHYPSTNSRRVTILVAKLFIDAQGFSYGSMLP